MPAPFVARLFARRLRGVRVVDLAAMAFLAVVVLGVYAFKAGAGRESAQIADVDRQILDERRELRRLRAEAAHLEQPARLERLAQSYLALGPAQARREARAEGLSELAHASTDAAPAPAQTPAQTPAQAPAQAGAMAR